ncbi:MAG: M23 family metallopeptidase [Deltaproteobacteria bacterium]|nr:M23 family metallopeptidase [Deltaproteobacteria bacterium]
MRPGLVFTCALLLVCGGAAGQPALPELALGAVPPDPQRGQVILFELEGARPGDRVGGAFLGRSLRFFVDGRGRVRALAAVNLEDPTGMTPAAIRLESPEGETRTLSRPIRVRPGRFERQELRVDPRYVRPPASARERIQRERTEMRRLFEAAPTPRAWRGSFVWPREDEITSPFGLRRLFNDELASRHWGLDIDGRRGSPVEAIGAGRVVMCAKRYYSGGTVVIDHGLRLFSLYFHLSAIEVAEGQAVRKGQRIGRVGRSGRATGPHLHVGTKVEDVSFDPVSLFDLDLDEGVEP